jgi:hypothetical protein
MKNGHKLVLSALLAIGILLLAGWSTSTRDVDMRFLKDGVPLSGRSLVVLTATDAGWENATYNIAQDGWVRLPSSYLGKIGACSIEDGDIVHKYLAWGFIKGKTTVFFTPTGNESVHVYKYLFYQKRTTMEPQKSYKISEQAAAGQPAIRPESK